MRQNLFIITILLCSCQQIPGKKVINEDCKAFRKGKFIQTWQDDSNQYKIERNDSLQKEFIGNKGGFITLRITWTSSCTYELIFLNQHSLGADSITNPEGIRKLKVEILQTKNDSCYILGDNGVEQIRGVTFLEKK